MPFISSSGGRFGAEPSAASRRADQLKLLLFGVAIIISLLGTLNAMPRLLSGAQRSATPARLLPT